MSTCLIKRLITLTVPVKYQRIVLFDENHIDVTASAMFSWSTDMTCWTNFVTLDQYNKLAPNIESDYYLRILIVSGFGELVMGGVVVDCYTICIYNENPYLADLCANQTIDFYANLDCALLMYQQLSDLVCCMVGIPCYYFRVLPNQDTADLTFKEYVLHNVVDMKYLKLVAPDGQMPSSKPQMTEFDFDWETDWEVEMSKTAFAKAFGDTAFPKQRDIIYIPLMKRMWEVNSAYDEKQEGFMWTPVTWKLGLVKWNDKTNVDQGDFESIIDTWANNRMESFLPKEREEQLRQTASDQTLAPVYKADNLYNTYLSDAVRAAVSPSERLSVVKQQLNHRAAIVSRNMYDFKDTNSVIQYQHRYCGDTGTLIFIINLCAKMDNKVLFQAGNVMVSAGYEEYDKSYAHTITFNDMTQELDPGIYVVHCRWDRRAFITSLNIYPYCCEVPEGTPSYLIRPEMYMFDFEHPICTLTSTYNNDFVHNEAVDVFLSPAPYGMTNIKLFDHVLSEDEACRESIKYTTKNEACVINDLARPFEEETGFAVK